MTSPNLFPWSKLREGQGFFVPGLDLEALRLAGLVEAQRQDVRKARALPAIRGGLIGVWFYLNAP